MCCEHSLLDSGQKRSALGVLVAALLTWSITQLASHPSKTSCVELGGVNWVGPTAQQVRSASECVRRSHRQCLRRPTHSDAERTCREVGPTKFTPPYQARQDGPVCVVSSGVPVWIGRLLWTCSDFKFSVGDSLELSGIQFTPPKRTQHRQDSFVASDVAVWISLNSVWSRQFYQNSDIHNYMLAQKKNLATGCQMTTSYCWQ